MAKEIEASVMRSYAFKAIFRVLIENDAIDEVIRLLQIPSRLEYLKCIFQQLIEKADLDGALKIVAQMPGKEQQTALFCIFDMLMKKEDLVSAQKVAKKMPSKSIPSWCLMDISMKYKEKSMMRRRRL